MIVDTNILLYAAHRSFGAQHERARPWLEQRLSTERIGLPWISLLAFTRLSTHPAVLERPMRPTEAGAQVGEWLDLPTVWVPAPGAEHVSTFRRMLGLVETGGNDVYDAHLAALAADHGAPLASADRGFDRFPITVVNPFED